MSLTFEAWRDQNRDWLLQEFSKESWTPIEIIMTNPKDMSDFSMWLEARYKNTIGDFKKVTLQDIEQDKVSVPKRKEIIPVTWISLLFFNDKVVAVLQDWHPIEYNAEVFDIKKLKWVKREVRIIKELRPTNKSELVAPILLEHFMTNEPIYITMRENKNDNSYTLSCGSIKKTHKDILEHILSLWYIYMDDSK